MSDELSLDNPVSDRTQPTFDDDDHGATPTAAKNGAFGVDDGRYTFLRRALTVMSARSHVCLRVVVLVVLALGCFLLLAVSPTAVTGRTERIPEDAPLMSMMVLMGGLPIAVALLCNIGTFSPPLATRGGYLDQLLLASDDATAADIERVTKRLFAGWLCLSAVSWVAGSNRVQILLAGPRPVLAVPVGFLYFLYNPVARAQEFFAPALLYAAVATHTERFPITTHKIVSSPSAVTGSRLLNKLNKECVALSTRLSPLVTVLVFGLLGTGGVGILTYTSGVIDHAEAAAFKATLPLFSFLLATAGLLVLYTVTSISSASVTMAEVLIEGEAGADDETDGLVTSLNDADLANGDTLTPEETVQLEIRQMFLRDAVVQQNGGNGMCVNRTHAMIG
eukprot:COSAG02_NODE_7179_length_3135_cov_20.129117_1_plen_393_part_00